MATTAAVLPAGAGFPAIGTEQVLASHHPKLAHRLCAPQPLPRLSAPSFSASSSHDLRSGRSWEKLAPLCGSAFVVSLPAAHRLLRLQGGAVARQQRRRPRCICAATGTTTDAVTKVVADEDLAFETQFRVYIEHTDCFGVVFYGNYFKFFQRALSEMYAKTGRQQPIIIGAKKARYANAARLGDLVTISVRQVGTEQDGSGHVRSWELVASTTAECVAASVIVAVQEDEVAIQPDAALTTGEWPPPPTQELGPPTKISPFDDYSRPVPSMHDLLCWFERSRSDSLGGPQALQDVVDLGILIVVARIEDFEYRPSLIPLDEASVPGRVAWEVRSCVDFKARRGQLICDERVYAVVDGDAAGAPCVARMVVTCVCVDESTRRICRGPPELVAMIEKAAARTAAQ
mmetsp:Transcript_67361/g.161511  ORF Transcript_67361/g.161511 Transcript_67361/m.161511 type:complete len:403 (+) Transcript_67361:61-1269(+)